MRQLLALALLACGALALAAAPVHAQGYAEIDYVGFGWETGGMPPSNAGDILAFSLIATAADPAFGIDFGTEECTLVITDLTSMGEMADFPFPGFTTISFSGGHIDVYEDSAMDHDWGINPPNATGGTFTNGNLLLSGDFTEFTLFFDAGGSGSFDGVIDGVGGTVASTCTDCAYTFGGAFTKDTGAQIPDGYDLQVDGTLEVDSAVSSEDKSWGSVKSLFN